MEPTPERLLLLPVSEMSRLHNPRVWLALFGTGAALVIAAIVVLVSAVGGIARGLEALLFAGTVTFAGVGWFVAYQQNLRARRADQDVSAARQATAAAALRDPLTGLGNHRLFDTHLQAAYARAQRYGHPFSVVLIEINLHGISGGGASSEAGEHILKYAGSVLLRELRGADLPARLGEATFGVVMPETEYEGAKLAWARLRDSLITQWPEQRSWSLSGGAAGYNVDVNSVESMLSDADRRLALEKRRLRAEPEP